MADPGPAPGSAPLNGWKEIAAYLGRSVRAVQRWERELGFPVHRIRSADGQTVYAFREEIDAWRATLDARPREPQQTPSASEPSTSVAQNQGQVAIRPEWRVHRVVGLIAGLLVVLGVGLFFSAQFSEGRVPQNPSSGRWNGRSFEALDSSGRVLWTHQFDRQVSPPPNIETFASIADLDGDGTSEVIVPVRFGQHGSKVTTTDSVYGFSHDGDVNWTVTPDPTLKCGTDTFIGPWDVRAVKVSEGSGKRVVWLAFVHHTWRPSFVVEVAHDGSTALRYVQAGWIFSIAEWLTPAGRFLAAGGIINEEKRASVALVDLSGPPPVLLASTTRNNCSDGSTIGFSRAFLLPRLETTVGPQPYEWVSSVRVVGTDLKVSYDHGHAILRIGPDLRVVEYALADSYFVWHRELEATGKVDHAAERCPFGQQPQEIQEWSPTTGWTSLRLQPGIRSSELR